MERGIEPTVGNFFVVLTSLLTQYDEKESLRELKRSGKSNIYRLGLLLEAKQKAEEEILFRYPEAASETMSNEIAGILIDVLAERFAVNHKTNEFDLSPLRKFYKQLDAFLSSGKRPSLVDR